MPAALIPRKMKDVVLYMTKRVLDVNATHAGSVGKALCKLMSSTF